LGLRILAKISNIPMKTHFVIRPIQQSDNVSLALVLRRVLVEFGVPETGTAYADPELNAMFETYQKPNCAYWVVSCDDEIFGGAGIAPLQNGPLHTCELQKMYFDKNARGKGLGQRIMTELLNLAHSFGFLHCYLETMPNMLDAQKLYKRNGFNYIDAPMGNTGHYSCPVWMVKELV
jgi:putative acetyltransferase